VALQNMLKRVSIQHRRLTLSYYSSTALQRERSKLFRFTMRLQDTCALERYSNLLRQCVVQLPATAHPFHQLSRPLFFSPSKEARMGRIISYFTASLPNHQVDSELPKIPCQPVEVTSRFLSVFAVGQYSVVSVVLTHSVVTAF